MHEIYNFVCDELKEIEEKLKQTGNMSKAEFEYADDLTDMKEKIMKIWKLEEELDGGMYSYAAKYPGTVTRDGNMSTARGRQGNVRRDEMGRYSRADEFTARLEELMNNAPDDNSKRKIERLVAEMKNV